MNYHEIARRALEDERPGREEALSVINAPDHEILRLLDAAFSVRRTYFGKKVQIHYLINAKSGICPEDCGYCSQSSVSSAQIDRYELVDEEQLLEGASRAEGGRFEALLHRHQRAGAVGTRKSKDSAGPSPR